MAKTCRGGSGSLQSFLVSEHGQIGSVEVHIASDAFFEILRSSLEFGLKA